MQLWSTGTPMSRHGAAALACRPPAHTFDPHILVAWGARGYVGFVVMNVTFAAFELTRSLLYS